MWKILKEYDNKYKINEKGVVFSLITNQEVKHYKNKNNCEYVILYDKNSKRHSLSINKLLNIYFKENLMDMYSMSKINLSNYLINKDGVIYSLKTRKFLKPNVNKYGYKRFCFVDDNNKRVKKFLHILLALMFIPNPNNLDTVDHIDNNSKNNSIDNLQWLSRKDNVIKENKNRFHKLQRA